MLYLPQTSTTSASSHMFTNTLFLSVRYLNLLVSGICSRVMLISAHSQLKKCLLGREFIRPKLKSTSMGHMQLLQLLLSLGEWCQMKTTLSSLLVIGHLYISFITEKQKLYFSRGFSDPPESVMNLFPKTVCFRVLKLLSYDKVLIVHNKEFNFNIFKWFQYFRI